MRARNLPGGKAWSLHKAQPHCHLLAICLENVGASMSHNPMASTVIWIVSIVTFSTRTNMFTEIVTKLAWILEVPSLNLSQDTDYSIAVPCNFLLPIWENARILHEVSLDCCLFPFQFPVHYHSISHRLTVWVRDSINKKITNKQNKYINMPEPWLFQISDFLT
jgi:hypothetical protein